MLDEIDREYERLTGDLGAATVARQARRSTATVDARRLRKDLAAVEAALGRLAADRARRVITAAEHAAATELLRADLTRLQETLSQVERVTGAPPPEGFVRLAKALRKRWDRMTPEEKNRALKTLVRQVRVSRAVSYRQPVAERVEVLFF